MINPMLLSTTTPREEQPPHSIITMMHNHLLLQIISVQLIWTNPHLGGEWNSGETLAVTLSDQDLNKNTASNEDLTLALGQ